MGKTKISAKQKAYSASIAQSRVNPKLKLRKDTGVRRWDPTKEILKGDTIAKAVWECLLNGDSEGAIEMILIYLDVVNQARMLKKSPSSRPVAFHGLRSKNPTIKTLAKLIHEMHPS